MKKLIVLIALLVGGLWYYGQTLPAEVSATSTVVITAPQDTVFRAIRAIGNQPLWWTDVKTVRILRGKRRESWEQNLVILGLVSFEITRAEPPNRLSLRYIPNEEQTEEEMRWSGTWNIRVRETTAGTEVRVVEELRFHTTFTRVYFRLRGRYRGVDSYLSSLAAHFGEVASPRHGEE